MIKIVVILAFVLIQFQGYSFEFRGVVNDDRGSAIPFVSVFESTTNQGVKSNEKGEFVLVFKENGSYVVRFSQVGYSVKTITVSDITIPPVIVLQSISQLKTIEVYGQTNGEKQEGKGFQVEVVKLENEQNTGSFKIRGVMNKI